MKMSVVYRSCTEAIWSADFVYVVNIHTDQGRSLGVCHTVQSCAIRSTCCKGLPKYASRNITGETHVLP